MKSNVDLQIVKNKAVDFLSRREHSEHELREKLLAKGFDQALVDLAMQSMLEAGYLSDERYARMVMLSSFDKSHGPQKVRFKLQQKKVSNTVINQTFEAFEGDWFSLAASLRNRKFTAPLNKGDKQEYYKERSRQMRFLAGRGFTMDQIEHAMSETSEIE